MKTFFFCLFCVVWVFPCAARVVINELMVDPTPAVTLPEHEYIELYNSGDSAVNLGGWVIGSQNSRCMLPDFNLAPGSYVIVAATSSKAAFDSFGASLYLPGFPSLNNDGKRIFLLNSTGAVEDIVEYSGDWYGAASKAAGGWSLERKDPEYRCPCAENWTASTDGRGGTPGLENSVRQTIRSEKQATVDRITGITDSSVVLQFSQPMDSTSVLDVTNYTLDHSLGNPLGIHAKFPGYMEVTLFLPTLLAKGEVYRAQLSNNITSCPGAAIDQTTLKFALPDSVEPGDLSINELLFNPRAGCSDFIEIVNISTKVLDLSGICIANKDLATATIESIKKVGDAGRLMFPGDYILVTDDVASTREQYSFPEDVMTAELPALPSFPDKEGVACVLDAAHNIIDEFHYSEKQHHEQLTDVEGVSLEKINPKLPGNKASNWHSAASSVGFATPGYVNSQYVDEGGSDGSFSLSPRSFSPDNDGVDDVVVCSFTLPADGYMGTISVYDINGQLVRYVVDNQTLPTAGSVFWDGTNDDREILPVGIYIILMDAFNNQGDRTKKRTTCSLLSR